MSYFILMGRRIPKQAITGFKFQNETDNIRPFLSIRIRGKDECFLLWLIFTLLLSFTVIGLVISVSDEWQEMGDKIIDKL